MLLLGVYLRKMKTRVHQKDLHKNIHNSFIGKSLSWKLAQVFIKRRIKKQTVVCSYTGISLINREEQIITTTWVNLKIIMLSESYYINE